MNFDGLLARSVYHDLVLEGLLWCVCQSTNIGTGEDTLPIYIYIHPSYLSYRSFSVVYISSDARHNHRKTYPTSSIPTTTIVGNHTIWTEYLASVTNMDTPKIGIDEAI